jgi:hypothetical protein
VAAHSDSRIGANFVTLWLFTKGGRCVRGEGPSDAAALDAVRRQVGLLAKPEQLDAFSARYLPHGVEPEADESVTLLDGHHGSYARLAVRSA